MAIGLVGILIWAFMNVREFKQQPDTRDLRERTQRMGEDYLARRPQGALVIGLVQKSKSHWLGFGQVSVTNTNPPSADTLFEIGSVTKAFTGIALASLAQDGTVRLEDTIAKHLPSDVKLPAELRPVTLVQLATHTAGLPRLPDNLDSSDVNATNPYALYTANDLHRYLRTARLDCAPGRKSEYSNVGVGLLGHILELKAGVPYEKLLRKRICEPLGMADTVMTLSGAQRERLTPGHDADGKVVSNWDFDVLAPAGGLRSSVGDMLKVIQANLATNVPGLGPALALAQKKHFESWIGKVGLCWQILEAPGLYQFHWHNGGTGGYASFIGFDVQHQIGIVVLSNYGDAMAGDDSLDELGMELLKFAVKISWE
jgi:CubicO group peptidase (beta-lactamase class C family)